MQDSESLITKDWLKLAFGWHCLVRTPMPSPEFSSLSQYLAPQMLCCWSTVHPGQSTWTVFDRNELDKEQQRTLTETLEIFARSMGVNPDCKCPDHETQTYWPACEEIIKSRGVRPRVHCSVCTEELYVPPVERMLTDEQGKDRDNRYGKEGGWVLDKDGECGHILGYFCLYEWIVHRIRENDTNNWRRPFDCPICRTRISCTNLREIEHRYKKAKDLDDSVWAPRRALVAEQYRITGGRGMCPTEFDNNVDLHVFDRMWERYEPAIDLGSLRGAMLLSAWPSGKPFAAKWEGGVKFDASLLARVYGRAFDRIWEECLVELGVSKRRRKALLSNKPVIKPSSVPEGEGIKFYKRSLGNYARRTRPL